MSLILHSVSIQSLQSAEYSDYILQEAWEYPCTNIPVASIILLWVKYSILQSPGKLLYNRNKFKQNYDIIPFQTQYMEVKLYFHWKTLVSFYQNLLSCIKLGIVIIQQVNCLDVDWGSWHQTWHIVGWSMCCWVNHYNAGHEKNESTFPVHGKTW